MIEIGRPREAEPHLVAALAYFESLGTTHRQYAEASCELARARLLQRHSAEELQRLQQHLPTYRSWGVAEREVVASLDRLILPDKPARGVAMARATAAR